MGRRAGFLSTMIRISREAERAERRRMRDAAAQMRAYRQMTAEHRKLVEMQVAASAVEEFESTLAALSTVHRECSAPVDWMQVLHAVPFVDCGPTAHARAAVETFKPTFFERLFGSTKRRQQLEQALAAALAHEEAEWSRVCAEVDEGKRIAARVLDGDTAAYTAAIEASACLEELVELGCNPVGKWIDRHNAWTTVRVGGPDVVPSESKALTASGKLSSKRIPASKQNEIYQDFVCGVALRVGRELTAVLPLHGVLCDVVAPVLDTRSGNVVETVILSVYCPAERLHSGGVNFARVDASDLVSTFMHSMKLVKSKGFQPVASLPASTISHAPGLLPAATASRRP